MIIYFFESETGTGKNKRTRRGLLKLCWISLTYINIKQIIAIVLGVIKMSFSAILGFYLFYDGPAKMCLSVKTSVKVSDSQMTVSMFR